MNLQRGSCDRCVQLLHREVIFPAWLERGATAGGRHTGCTVRRMKLHVPTLAILTLLAGCSSTVDVTAEELCADPARFEGQRVRITTQLDGSSFALTTQTLAGCTDPMRPCCNAGWYAYTLQCAGGVDVAFIPEGTVGSDPPSEFIVRAAAGGGVPAECDPASAPDLGTRTFEGSIAAQTTDARGRPIRYFTFDASTRVE